jgi:Fe-S cluster assembly iron-binding protein IscA
MSFVRLTPEAARSIKTFQKEKGIFDPIRVDLQSTGCCDSSLGLFLDRPRPDDLVQESVGLRFVISPDVYKTVGDVTIAFVEEKDKKGFIITSSRPLSEWEGFGVCDIRITDNR